MVIWLLLSRKVKLMRTMKMNNDCNDDKIFYSSMIVDVSGLPM